MFCAKGISGNINIKSKKRWKKRFGEYKYQMLLDFHECDKAR